MQTINQERRKQVFQQVESAIKELADAGERLASEEKEFSVE